ncbi:hypothetical protein EDF88_4642 [Buttiauxella sp. BIGb0552]|uniref:Uncharacterized protein n=1 Tax=Buttiauxella agrestis TaxID=82977 RepID=A0A381KNA0_9ENTR|nr:MULTISPECIES: hypothetical protein [Buttiauxella]TDX12044.1 hypothetical protein EDF88_4642 [Buttiauxella sp. BIGb0552]SUY92769.1 Uncharacterised protein [Buttiauxella agrestis]
MKSNSKTVRVYKEQILLSFACWLYMSPPEEWMTKAFSGRINKQDDEHYDQTHSDLYFFRFALNGDGFESGPDANGVEIFTFSFNSWMLPDSQMSEKHQLTKLVMLLVTGSVVSVPEYIDLPESLEFEIRDQILTFDLMRGENVFKGWKSASELWANDVFPHTSLYLNSAQCIH